MALYEYCCPIHDVFEHIQSISDPHLESCPKCTEEGRQQWDCRDCNSVMYSPSNVEIATCAQCSGNNLLNSKIIKPKRLISLSSFSLVGSGWAKDLYSK